MYSSPDSLYVIFPAAGSGTRMHSDKNKLLMEVNGIPVIERTMAAFQKFSSEKNVKIHGVLVVTPGKKDEWSSYIKDNPVFGFIDKITEGGDTRTKSVSRGVASVSSLSPEDDDIVFIHDAARCLIDTDSILRCFEEMRDGGSDVCVSGVKTKNTIKIVRSASDGEPVTVESTPDRSLLYEVQTPQCFKFSVLSDCYSRAEADEYEATDDTALAEHYGYEVRIVEGSYSNIKITTPEDIAIAEALISS